MTPRVRPVDAARMAVGAILAVRPGLAARVVGERPSGTTSTAARILAVRLLGQAVAGAALRSGGGDRRRLVERVDLGVETLHGLSMLGLAAAVPAHRRLALAGGVLAGVLVALEVVSSGGGS